VNETGEIEQSDLINMAVQCKSLEAEAGNNRTRLLYIPLCKIRSTPENPHFKKGLRVAPSTSEPTVI
jgi:hypothetical protein